MRLTDTDKPESQTAITASFVDENGKHIGGGGTTEIHTDDTLAGTGTTDNPLKLSDTANSKIAKAGTVTEDNLFRSTNVQIPNASADKKCRIVKDGSGYLCAIALSTSGVGAYHEDSLDVDVLACIPASSVARGTVSIGENISVDSNAKISVPAITAIKNISTLEESATLTEVVAKVNEILNAVKNTVATVSDEPITDPGLGEPSIMDSE
jgi:hypothetical protein